MGMKTLALNGQLSREQGGNWTGVPKGALPALVGYFLTCITDLLLSLHLKYSTISYIKKSLTHFYFHLPASPALFLNAFQTVAPSEASPHSARSDP